MSALVIVGIDPDARKCGVCSMIDGTIDALMSEETAQLIASIPALIERNAANNNRLVFAVENVNQNGATYFRRGMSKQAIANRISQNVGMVKAAQTIIVDCIKLYRGEVLLVPPGIGKQTKNNAALFAQLTGYKGSTNEDTRDAYWVAHYANKKISEDMAWLSTD